MIPTRCIEELKNAPDDTADFTGSFLEVGQEEEEESCARTLGTDGL